MRALCTVSAPLSPPSASGHPPPPSGSRYLVLRAGYPPTALSTNGTSLSASGPLTGHQPLYFLVEAKSRVRELQARMTTHLAENEGISAEDAELFGLAVLCGGEYLFADPDSKLSKYAPKSWRASHTHGLDANGRPLLELYYRVRYYVEAPGAVLRDASARRRYYEQLKENAATREHRYLAGNSAEILQPGSLAQERNQGSTSHLGPNLLGQNHLVDQNFQSLGQNYQSVGEKSQALGTGTTEQALLALGGLALQVDKGDAPEEGTCALGYFDLEEYAPLGLRNAWGAAALRACHLDNAGLDRDQALSLYLREASRLHDSVNCHVFRMRAAKIESGPGSIWLSVGPRGLRVAPVERSHLVEQCVEEHQFPWPSIAKLSFDRRKFEIRSGDKRLVLYAAGDDKSKLLLALCRDSHQFSLKMAPRLVEARKREDEEDRKRSLMLRDCCAGGYRTHALRTPYGKSIGKSDDQRVSVISSTSSNTTSGIVSDRVHSEDELEIMIDTPPVAVAAAAPSTESLAFAHLLDGANSSRISQDVSRQASSVGQVSLKDLEETLAALSVAERNKSLCSSIAEKSYSSGSPTPTSVESLLRQSLRASAKHLRMDSHRDSAAHKAAIHLSTVSQAAAALLCQSSQCSSSCSTDVAPVGIPVACTNRRASAASSLELGYSHTAQNSALSQESTTCVDTVGAGDGEYGVSVREEDSTSGVYTLRASETSGIYTMASSEPTTDPADSDVTESLDYGSFLPASVAASDTLSSTGPSIDQIDSRHSNSFRQRENAFRAQQEFENSFGLREDSLRQHEDSFALRKDSVKRHEDSFALRKDSLKQHEDSFALREDSLRQHEDSFIREDTFNRLKDSFRREDSFAQRENSFRREEKFNKLQDSFAREDLFNKRGDSFRREDTFAKQKQHSYEQKDAFTQQKQDSFSQPEDPFRQLDDAFRPRTDSTISASGSFHGDGSDPTDARRGLLSADELSELIVGKPDVDSDYVLLPANGVNTAGQVLAYPGVVPHTKDPPPYPTEAPARFVTTRPNINILTAHASAVNATAEPSFSSNRAATVTQHRYSNVSTCNNMTRPPPPAYPDELIPRRSAESVAYRHPQTQTTSAASALIPSTMQTTQQSQQLQRYNPSPVHHHTLSQQQQLYQHDINQQQLYQHDISQQQLYQHDINQQQLYQHELNQQQYQQSLKQQHHRPYLPPQPPPPAPMVPRRPPPPPVAAVVTRSQLEQFQQQLYSDVDYVIYPLQDPAISKQEYLDSKLAALAAHANPPPYPHRRQTPSQSPGTPLYPHHHAKGHVLYRSAPYLPLAAFTAHSRYASTQNLSDAYVQLPAGYSTATLYAAAASRYEAPPPPLPRRVMGPTFTRARSDDNILNSVETATRTAVRYKRLPPPPPPAMAKPPMPSPPMDAPYRTATLPHSSSTLALSSSTTNCSTMPHRTHIGASSLGFTGTSTLPHRAHTTSAISLSQVVANISASSAKCSVTSSITKNTSSNTSVALTGSTPSKTVANSPTKTQTAVTTTPATTPEGNTTSATSPIDIRTLREKSKNLDLPMISALCNDRSLLKQTKAFVMPSSGATKLKYSVNTAPKKPSVTGQKRNPNDKLPALPGQEIAPQMTRTTTKGNNYVLNGPGCQNQKHKSVHSQS